MRQASLFAPVPPPAVQPTVTLHHGDCLDIMPTLAAGSVQMVFADLPYGVTKCAWDGSMPAERLWQAINYVAQDGCVGAFTATFSFALTVVSASPWPLRYDLVWHKRRRSGFYGAKSAPLRAHENILIFGQPGSVYNPEMASGKRYSVTTASRTSAIYGSKNYRADNSHDGVSRYPDSVLMVDESDLRNDTLNGNTQRRLHPTQKPVALLEWLIRTYTNEGDTVLDPTAGSGTTAIAALRTGRNVVCIEKDAGYFEVLRKRVADEQARLGYEVTV